MKKRIIICLVSIISLSATAQFVAKMEVKEPIPGVCNEKEVYTLFPSFKGQKEAACPVTKEEILKKLNSEVPFIIENPGYTDKGMIGLVINCKGAVVKCKMDNKTKSEELDKQIENVFSTLGEWKSGKLNGKEVDTSKLFSFTITDSIFSFE